MILGQPLTPPSLSLPIRAVGVMSLTPLGSGGRLNEGLEVRMQTFQSDEHARQSSVTFFQQTGRRATPLDSDHWLWDFGCI